MNGRTSTYFNRSILFKQKPLKSSHPRASNCLFRSQLNIKIDPLLLAQVKSEAIKQGVTVTEFVTAALTKALNGDGAGTVEERLRRLEQHLGLDKKV